MPWNQALFSASFSASRGRERESVKDLPNPVHLLWCVGESEFLRTTEMQIHTGDYSQISTPPDDRVWYVIILVRKTILVLPSGKSAGCFCLIVALEHFQNSQELTILNPQWFLTEKIVSSKGQRFQGWFSLEISNFSLVVASWLEQSEKEIRPCRMFSLP